jgi:hypothetical protein
MKAAASSTEVLAAMVDRVTFRYPDKRVAPREVPALPSLHPISGFSARRKLDHFSLSSIACFP